MPPTPSMPKLPSLLVRSGAALLLVGTSALAAQQRADGVTLVEILEAEDWELRNRAAASLLSVERPTDATIARLIRVMREANRGALPSHGFWGGWGGRGGGFPSPDARLRSLLTDDVSAPSANRVRYGRAIRTGRDLVLPYSSAQLAACVLGHWAGAPTLDAEERTALVDAALGEPVDEDTAWQIGSSSFTDTEDGWRDIEQVLARHDRVDAGSRQTRFVQAVLCGIASRSLEARARIVDWVFDGAETPEFATRGILAVHRQANDGEREALRARIGSGIADGTFDTRLAALIRVPSPTLVEDVREASLPAGARFRDFLRGTFGRRLDDEPGSVVLLEETENWLERSLPASQHAVFARMLWRAAHDASACRRYSKAVREMFGGTDGLATGSTGDGPRSLEDLLNSDEPGAEAVVAEVLFGLGRVWRIAPDAPIDDDTVSILRAGLSSNSRFERYTAALTAASLGARLPEDIAKSCAPRGWLTRKLDPHALDNALALARSRIRTTSRDRASALAALPVDGRPGTAEAFREFLVQDATYSFDRMNDDQVERALVALRALTDEAEEVALLKLIRPTSERAVAVWAALDWLEYRPLPGTIGTLEDWIELLDDSDVLAASVEHAVTRSAIDDLLEIPLRRLAEILADRRSPWPTRDFSDDVLWQIVDGDSERGWDVRGHALDCLTSAAIRGRAAHDRVRRLADEMLAQLLEIRPDDFWSMHRWSNRIEHVGSQRLRLE